MIFGTLRPTLYSLSEDEWCKGYVHVHVHERTYTRKRLDLGWGTFFF
jgi:hypothetical protein